MRKIGRPGQFFSTILVSLLFSLPGLAQVEVSATLSETNIYEGERVQLEITISGNSINSVEQPVLPEFEGLRWLRGNISRGQSYTFSNGEPSVTYTYGYQLISQNPGSYTLPPITVKVNDETLKTEPLSFKVLDPKTVNPDKAKQSPDIYVRIEPNTTSPVVGEQVLVEVVLYFKRGIEVSSYQAAPGWKAEGFWKEELEKTQRATTTSTIINGIRYQRAKLIQYALFPTKAGELTLSPFEISVTVRTHSRNSFDPFNFRGQEQQKLETLPVKLDVNPLPELEDAQFIGAVGNFEISREINPVNAYVGESVEIITKISGTGNVPLVNKPDYDFPESLELYNPQESSRISRSTRQISGTKTFTDVIIARNEGNFTIPALTVAYFNPEEERFITKQLPALSFSAERDPDAVASSGKKLRLDVQPVTGLASWTTKTREPLHTKPWVWILLVAPVILTGGAFAYKNYQTRMNTDTAFARSQKAKDKAINTLDKAASLSDIKEGYNLINKALVQFITDKLNLPPAGLSNEKIVSEVESIAGDETATEVRRLLTKCETIAYAPNATQEAMNTDIKKTRELLKTIGKLA